MNKKLFFAGFALLAAVSFTSCSTDTPIDITNPNGVTPTASNHYVGNGEYDWTAIVKNYDELKDFWTKDGKDVADLLKKNKDNTADILIDVTGFELKATDGANGDGYLMIPDFWAANGGTATANGKVVNITFKGNFKNADFERAHMIAGDGKALPVKIKTDNVKGAEVNFTFNVEKFDLELASTLTRSTLSGDYTIGYMKAQAAEKLSALEVKEGTVEGLDVESTGDYKGTIGGAWTKTADNFIRVAKSGIRFVNAGVPTANVISGAKNLFIEKDADLNPYYNDNGTKVYALGVVKFVQKAKTNATLGMAWLTNNLPYSIESIEGIGAQYSFINVSRVALDNVESVNKVTIIGPALTLKKDIFTDVIFNNAITINTKEISSLDKVTFNGNTTIEVADDNQTLAFNGVNFNNTPVRMRSGMSIENTTAYTLYDYYQWVVSDDDASKGQWVMYKTDHTWMYNLTAAQKVIKEYNKDKEVVEYSDQDVSLDSWDATLSQPCGQLVKKAGKNPDLSKATHLIKIGDYYEAGTVEVIPEGTKLVLDGNCTFGDEKTDAALNVAYGNVGDLKQTWYDVTYGDKAYSWRRIQSGGTYVYWALVPVK